MGPGKLGVKTVCVGLMIPISSAMAVLKRGVVAAHMRFGCGREST
jgi:hypothetical protein